MSFLSELEILGNGILNYGIHHEQVRAQKNDGFKHALLSDMEYVYVGIEKGEPKIKLMNSVTVISEKNQDERFTQNGDWAGNRTVESIERIIEKWGHQMDKEDLKKLEDRLPGASTPEITGAIDVNRESTLMRKYAKNVYNQEFLSENVGNYTHQNDNNYHSFQDYAFVVHVEWKWLREVGFLETYDDYGEKDVKVVDATYPIPKGARKVEFTNKWGDPSIKHEWIDIDGYPVSLEKLWIPRVWEGVRIDDDIYAAVREKPNQVLDLDNPFKSTLGYHGLTFNSMNAKSVSLMERMKPFQFLFFVVLHQIKELIPKHIGPIQNFDTSMIDPNLGGVKGEGEGDNYDDALSKTLYYRQKGLNIYNSMMNNIGGQGVQTNVSRPQPGSVQNMSVAGDLNNLLNLLGWIDVQIGMAAGVSPQREAQFSANSNVSDNQQAIVQSSHITEHYFRKHNDLWKEVMESYINYAELAWAGKNMKKQYILEDTSLKTLEIKETSFNNSSFGLFVQDSGKEQEYMDDMKNLVQAFVQNDASIEQVSYILKSRANGSSPEKIHKEIVKLQREMDERNAQAQQSQLESAEKMQEREIEHREDTQEHEIQIQSMKDRTAIKVAEVKSFSMVEDQDINDNGVPDQLELEKLRLASSKLQADIQKHKDNTQLKREDMKMKEKLAKEKLAADKEKARNSKSK